MNTRAITAVSSVIASDKLTKVMNSRNQKSEFPTVSLSFLPLRFSGSFTAYRLVNRLGCIPKSPNYEMSMQRHEKRRDIWAGSIECVLMPLLYMTDFWLLYFWHLNKITPSISIKLYIDMDIHMCVYLSHTHKHTRAFSNAYFVYLFGLFKKLFLFFCVFFICLRPFICYHCYYVFFG